MRMQVIRPDVEEIAALLCWEHFHEFSRWCGQTGIPKWEAQIALDNLDAFLARTLRKLAIQAADHGVFRCEYVRTGAGRCWRFAATNWNGHNVCNTHARVLGRLGSNAPRSGTFSFERVQTDSTSRIQEMVTELLNRGKPLCP